MYTAASRKWFNAAGSALILVAWGLFVGLDVAFQPAATIRTLLALTTLIWVFWQIAQWLDRRMTARTEVLVALLGAGESSANVVRIADHRRYGTDNA